MPKIAASSLIYSAEKTQDQLDREEYEREYNGISDKLHAFALENATDERIKRQIKI